MKIMGPIQHGLPLLSALRENWPLIVVPSIIHEEPNRRYQ